MSEYFREPLYAALASFSWRETLVHERVSQKAQFFAGASQLECPALHGFKKKRRERNVEVKRKKEKKKRKHREAIARSFQEVHRPRRDLPGCEREQKIIKRGNTDSASKEESQRRGKRRNRE